MLLERLGDRAEAPAGPAGVATLSGSAEDQTLVARIVAKTADRARSSDELHGSLDELRSQGLQIDAAQLLRLLAHNLPNQAPPPTADAGTPAPQGAARAMGQLVTMSRTAGEKAQRFQELVTSAVEEFNGGSLGRAVTMIDLAERLAESQAVDGATVTSTHSRAHDALDLEAMAAGRPVVSTDLGTGTSFVNVHQETGLDVEPRNPDALAQAINHLLGDEPLRRRLGTAGRQRVEMEFAADIMVERTIDLYGRVLKTGGA